MADVLVRYSMCVCVWIESDLVDARSFPFTVDVWQSNHVWQRRIDLDRILGEVKGAPSRSVRLQFQQIYSKDTASDRRTQYTCWRMCILFVQRMRHRMACVCLCLAVDAVDVNKKNGTTTEWMGEEKELIKIFFDRFSNLEIIFFSASAGIVAIRWIRRLASSTTFAVYLQSGVLGIEFECLNGLLAFNDSTTHILNSQLLKQREFDSIWIFRLIWITSKGNCPRLYRENRSECEKSVGLPFSIGNFHITYQMAV